MKIEDIEKKSQECAERIANIAYAGGGHIVQDDLEMAFGNGAEWRINSVWHDASEKPKEKEHIVVVTTSGSFTSWYVSSDIMEVFLKYNIVKWAYSEDLLPTKD